MVPPYLGILLLPAVVFGGNFSLSVRDDTRRVIDLGVFGFSNGAMELTIHHLSMKNPADEKRSHEPIGFTLDWVTTAPYARLEKNYGKGIEAQKKICFIEDPATEPKQPPVNQWRKVFPLQKQLSEGKAKEIVEVHRVSEPGLYALFFYNCKGYSDKDLALQSRPVTFKVSVSQYNMIGATPDFLSIGSSKLPLMYLGFAAIFLVLTVVWISAMRASPGSVHKIHYLMAILAILKTTSLFFEGMKYHYQQRTGAPSGWDVMYYIFLTLKGITLFTVILLLGSGWSFLKPFLSKQEKHIVLIVLVLQVIVNTAMGIIEESSEGMKNWALWNGVLRLLDAACCAVVVIPAVMSINKLRSLSSRSEKMARNVVRLKQFKMFYLLVVLFMYFTRIVVVVLDTRLPFNYTWISPFIQEASAVLFYLFTGVRFKPMEDNPFLNPEDVGEEEEELQHLEHGQQ